MYSRVVFYRRYVLGESEDKAKSKPLNPTLEMYVRCYFETDWGRLRLATLRLRREIGRLGKDIGRALWIDKIVGLWKRKKRIG